MNRVRSIVFNRTKFARERSSEIVEIIVKQSLEILKRVELKQKQFRCKKKFNIYDKNVDLLTGLTDFLEDLQKILLNVKTSSE